MGHLKITSLRPVFKISGGNEHERKSRETRPRAVERQRFITRQRKLGGK